MRKNDEENRIYVTNRKKGKLITLFGGFLTLSGAFGMLSIPQTAIIYLVIGLVVMAVGKGITWYHN